MPETANTKREKEQKKNTHTKEWDNVFVHGNSTVYRIHRRKKRQN